MRTKIPYARWLASLALTGFACTAQASFTTYTSQVSFLAGATASGTDTFDSLLPGELADSVVRSAGGFSYTASALSGLYGLGSSDMWLSSADRRDSISFTSFSTAVSAIGGVFFGTNEAGMVLADQRIVITVTDTALNQSSTLLTSNGASSFFGVVSSLPILSLTVAVDAGNLLAAWPTVNNLVVAVPEPSSYALLAAGLVAVGLAARRRTAV